MSYSESKLIICANELGMILRLPKPDEEKVKQLIDEILIKRENYKGALTGIITHEEAASLILQHFHSRIFNLVDSPHLTEYSWNELINKTKHALFNQKST